MSYSLQEKKNLMICVKSDINDKGVSFQAFQKTLLRQIFLDQGDQGPMLWFFKYFRRKIQRKNWRFWLKTKLNFGNFWS
jgi:hypothetical protein